MISETEIRNLLLEAQAFSVSELERSNDGFILRAHYHKEDDTFSVYLVDSTRNRGITYEASFNSAISLAMEELPQMIEEARRKNAEFAKPPRIATLEREHPGIKVMVLAPGVLVHRTFIGEDGERRFVILPPGAGPIPAGEKELVSKCAGLISLQGLEEADPLIYGGKELVSCEVAEEQHVVTVKPKSRVFDGEWIATLFVQPGCAYIAGWASDISYSWLLHDCIVAAAKEKLT